MQNSFFGTRSWLPFANLWKLDSSQIYLESNTSENCKAPKSLWLRRLQEVGSVVVKTGRSKKWGGETPVSVCRVFIMAGPLYNTAVKDAQISILRYQHQWQEAIVRLANKQSLFSSLALCVLRTRVCPKQILWQIWNFQKSNCKDAKPSSPPRPPCLPRLCFFCCLLPLATLSLWGVLEKYA